MLPTLASFIRHQADPLVHYDDRRAVEVAQRYYDQADEVAAMWPGHPGVNYLRLWGDVMAMVGIDR